MGGNGGGLFAIIVFSEIASERGWPFYVWLLFLAAVWGVLSLAYRDTLGEITRRQLAMSAMGAVALVGGLATFMSIANGVWAIAIAFAYIVVLAALMNLALRRT